MNAHTGLAIAQIVFYVPAAAYAHYIGIRLRLAGGILVIVYEQDKTNISIVTATYILLNLGLVPLLTAYNRLHTLIAFSNFPNNNSLKKISKLCGIMLLVAAGLLGAAGGSAGKPEKRAEWSKLTKIAYAEFLAVLVILVLLCARMYFRARSQIRNDHVIYLRWLLIAAVPMGVRTAYSIIGVVDASNKGLVSSNWSPLFGSVAAFGLMGLLPEFIVLCIFMYLGHTRLRVSRGPTWVDDRPPKESKKGPDQVGSESGSGIGLTGVQLERSGRGRRYAEEA